MAVDLYTHSFPIQGLLFVENVVFPNSNNALAEFEWVMNEPLSLWELGYDKFAGKLEMKYLHFYWE